MATFSATPEGLKGILKWLSLASLIWNNCQLFHHIADDFLKHSKMSINQVCYVYFVLPFLNFINTYIENSG